jgi:histidinol-phosphate aminotransferase
LWRPEIRRLHAYVPGEQPSVPGLVKLNTNENPYPPARGVLRAVREAVDSRLRLYPNPTSKALRERLARLHRCGPDRVVVGNGSDELLAMAVRAFVDPGRRDGRRRARSLVQYFTPSYSLYPVLADMHGAWRAEVPLEADFGLPSWRRLERLGWEREAALTFVTTPNAPSGRGYSTAELDELCRRQRGVVVLDEAYVDFAREQALALALKYPHVLVARTFSKAYSLCFQRVGYCVGHPGLVAALDRIRDSYNVNGLGQVAALATLEHLPYYRRNFRRIRATRSRVTAALERLGFEVFPSETNFLLVRPPGAAAELWLQALRERRVLVRWFPAPCVCEYLRITVGSNLEMNTLLRAVRALVRAGLAERREE